MDKSEISASFNWVRAMILILLGLVTVLWLFMGIGGIVGGDPNGAILLAISAVLVTAFVMVLKRPWWGAILLIVFGIGFPVVDWAFGGWPLEYVLSNWLFYVPPLALGTSLLVALLVKRSLER